MGMNEFTKEIYNMCLDTQEIILRRKSDLQEWSYGPQYIFNRKKFRAALRTLLKSGLLVDASYENRDPEFGDPDLNVTEFAKYRPATSVELAQWKLKNNHG